MFSKGCWEREIIQDGVTSTDVAPRRHETGTKTGGMLGRLKCAIGRAVTVDEDWIFKSKDWPYLWRK